MLPHNEGKLIYSKRFPKIDLDAIHEDQGTPDEESLETEASLKEFYRNLMEDNVYVANPYKLKMRQRFLDAAIEFSKAFGIDMDIREYPYRVSATMYLSDCVFTGLVKEEFASLVVMCDCIDHLTSQTEKCGFSVTLDFLTHEHYFAGRKVDL